MAEFDQRLGRLIKQYRLMRGLSQSQLAEFTRQTPQTIDLFEKGFGDNRLNVLETLRVFLQIPGAKIFNDDDLELSDASVEARLVENFLQLDDHNARVAMIDMLKTKKK